MSSVIGGEGNVGVDVLVAACGVLLEVLVVVLEVDVVLVDV